ncbi:tyrosine-type recombinase/integrase [Salmonella enterica subsp. enterica]|nr:tyrosine-type recombinase/integrase [Salmonella enterica subsp. enterica]
MSKTVRRMGHKAGAKQPRASHKLRHSFATLMLESSGDLRGVETAGCANLSTANLYSS